MAEKDVYLARTHKVHVCATEDGNYTEIAGLLDHKISQAAAKADGTNRDDDGVSRYRVASRSLEVTISGFRYIDPDTGTVDPGQEIVELASQKIYPDEMLWFMITDVQDNEVFKWKASPEATSVGSGGVNDNADFAFTLTASGYWYRYGTRVG